MSNFKKIFFTTYLMSLATLAFISCNNKLENSNQTTPRIYNKNLENHPINIEKLSEIKNIDGVQELKLKTQNTSLDIFDMVYDSVFLKEIFEKPDEISSFSNWSIEFINDSNKSIIIDEDFTLFFYLTFWNNPNDKGNRIFSFKDFEVENLNNYLQLSSVLLEVEEPKLKENFKNLKFKDIYNYQSEKLNDIFQWNIDKEKYDYNFSINYGLSNYNYLTLDVWFNFKKNKNFKGITKNLVLKSIWDYTKEDLNELSNKQDAAYQEIIEKIFEFEWENYNSDFDIFTFDPKKIYINYDYLLSIDELNSENIFDYFAFPISEEISKKYSFINLNMKKINDADSILLELLIIDNKNPNVFVTINILLKNNERRLIFKPSQKKTTPNTKEISNKIFLSKFFIYIDKNISSLNYLAAEKEKLMPIFYKHITSNNLSPLLILYKNNKLIKPHFATPPLIPEIKIERFFTLNEDFILQKEEDSIFNYLNPKKINVYIENFAIKYDNILKNIKNKKNIVYFGENYNEGKLIGEDLEINYILSKEQNELLEFIASPDNADKWRANDLFKLNNNFKKNLKNYKNDPNVKQKSFFKKLIEKNVNFHNFTFTIEDVNFNFLDDDFKPKKPDDLRYLLLDLKNTKKNGIYLQINIYTKDKNYRLPLYYKIVILENEIKLYSLSDK